MGREGEGILEEGIAKQKFGGCKLSGKEDTCSPRFLQERLAGKLVMKTGGPVFCCQPHHE